MSALARRVHSWTARYVIDTWEADEDQLVWIRMLGGDALCIIFPNTGGVQIVHPSGKDPVWVSDATDAAQALLTADPDFSTWTISGCDEDAQAVLVQRLDVPTKFRKGRHYVTWD